MRIYADKPIVRMVYTVSGSGGVVLVFENFMVYCKHVYECITLLVCQLLKRRAEILLVAVEACGSRIGADTGYKNNLYVRILFLDFFNGGLSGFCKGFRAGGGIVHAEAQHKQVIAGVVGIIFAAETAGLKRLQAIFSRPAAYRDIVEGNGA